jgi:hypothetical protein
MLRIVLEFDDVIAPVVASHQVGLRTPAHPPDVLYGKHHGEACYLASLLHGKEIFLAPSNVLPLDCERRGTRIAASLLPSASKLHRQRN